MLLLEFVFHVKITEKFAGCLLLIKVFMAGVDVNHEKGVFASIYWLCFLDRKEQHVVCCIKSNFRAVGGEGEQAGGCM